MGRRRVAVSGVGSFSHEWWPAKYVNGTYVHTPPKPEYRKYIVKICIKSEPHTDPWYATRGYMTHEHKPLTAEELCDAEMTNKNSSSLVRREQAAELDAAGYGGPLGGGEARALKNLFTRLGKPDLVKRGWAIVKCRVWVQPTKRQIRQAAWASQPSPPAFKRWSTKLQYCYLFKSPIEGIHFSKFIRLARMYKDDSNKLRTAVEALLANPEAAKEIEMLDAMELLAGMKGMD